MKRHQVVRLFPLNKSLEKLNCILGFGWIVKSVVPVEPGVYDYLLELDEPDLKEDKIMYEIDTTAPNFYNVNDVHVDVYILIHMNIYKEMVGISWTRDPELCEFWKAHLNPNTPEFATDVKEHVAIQVLKNDKTGSGSIGWTTETGLIEEWIEHAHNVTYA